MGKVADKGEAKGHKGEARFLSLQMRMTEQYSL